MNTPNTPNTLHPSGPECARYIALLPRFRQGLLAPADDTSLRAHLNTCAYCRAHLARYDQLDATLRAYVGSYTPTIPNADALVRMAVAQRKENTMFDHDDSFASQDTIPSRQTYPTRPSSGNRRRPVLATIAAVLLVGLIAALFAIYGRGLGGTALGTPTVTVPATETATPEATDTPAPTATPAPPNGIVNQGYPCNDTNGWVYVQMGDLKVAAVRFSLDYSANELPNSLDPSKPYTLPDNLPSPPNPRVNPYSSSGSSNGYVFTVCNTSQTTSHILREVTVAIAAFTPYNGVLNSYQFCDGFYQRPYGAGGGGCGGGIAANESLHASFPASATTGAEVTATQVTFGKGDSPDPNADTVTALPIQLGPGQQLSFTMGVMPPTAPGLYTFRFGLNYDDVTSATISTMAPILFDSAAVKWSGQNCTSAQISQIPADSTAKYVCAPQG